VGDFKPFGNAVRKGTLCEKNKTRDFVFNAKSTKDRQGDFLSHENAGLGEI
jgi:hypothetical protein